jgi:hypothetical protein
LHDKEKPGFMTLHVRKLAKSSKHITQFLIYIEKIARYEGFNNRSEWFVGRKPYPGAYQSQHRSQGICTTVRKSKAVTGCTLPALPGRYTDL